MTLDELEIQQLALINYVDTDEDALVLFKFGVVPGAEIRKISSVKTCSEYMVENMLGTMVIDNVLAKRVKISELDETLDYLQLYEVR